MVAQGISPAGVFPRQSRPRFLPNPQTPALGQSGHPRICPPAIHWQILRHISAAFARAATPLRRRPLWHVPLLAVSQIPCAWPAAGCPGDISQCWPLAATLRLSIPKARPFSTESRAPLSVVALHAVRPRSCVLEPPPARSFSNLHQQIPELHAP